MTTANDRSRRLIPTATHWGSYLAEVHDGRLLALHPYHRDPDPSDIGPGMVSAVDHPSRIRAPAVRRGYLEHGPGPAGGARGSEDYVTVSWDEALDRAAAELRRVQDRHGNEAIFGGSYGWASAGRFHHSVGQLHRFLNCFGGYVRSVNTYSHAAAEVITNRVVGGFRHAILDRHTTWPTIARHGRLVVLFGGLARKNAQVNSGGVGRHTVLEGLAECRRHGVEFVNVSPARSDAAPVLDAEWLPVRPGTDTALMLGLAHTLLAEGLHDMAFLERYTVGFERFSAYLTGESDGTAKDATWAAAITGLEAGAIHGLARRMAAGPTLVNVAWALQRADHGEQPVWMAITLAAMLGQIGLPGGGFGIGYGSENGLGNPVRSFRWPAVPQGRNAVERFIPVARIADMLLHPGEPYDYDGQRLRYPDVRLVYWAGGNPFHHHQDLHRLVRAWQAPETVIVHEIWWNALARHADIVLPATTALERDDLAITHWEPVAVAMRQVIPPVGEARDDYRILAGLAERLGFAAAYTEGRDPEGWIRHLWDQSRQRAAEAGFELPDLDTFRRDGFLELPPPERTPVMLEEFRADPVAHPLETPSGRVEIHSETVAGFGYEDCPGHPVWREPREWLGSPQAARHPLHLLSCQPRTRLHSQADCGAVSQAAKVRGREPIRIHPRDAAARGIGDGDLVRVRNDRGACLAGAVLCEDLLPGVVQLATGAWFDPSGPEGLEMAGNPNVLTRDEGTSRLAQGPTAHSVLVEVEPFALAPTP